MTYLPSLPAGAVLLHVFRAYPRTAGPLLDYHQALLRGPSPFTVAQREPEEVPDRDPTADLSRLR